ncbi:hypothetical protein BH23BAC4_BH23BAC4_08210 [soil metagenome]
MKSLCFFLALFLVCAANAQISVQSPLSDDREAAIGSTYTGVVIVVNESTEAQQFRIYQTDYHFAADGSNRFAAAGSSHRSNAQWVELGARTYTVPPRETMSFGYSVTVPEALSEPGSYWSMLMVEGIPMESLESTLNSSEERQMGVLQVTRYGIQIATHVTGGEAGVSFEDVAIEAGADGHFLQVDLGNAGTRLADAALTVELFSSGGTALGRRGGDRFRIYPGTSVRHRIDLSDLPSDSYEALILVDAGGEALTGAQFTLEL